VVRVPFAEGGPSKNVNVGCPSLVEMDFSKMLFAFQKSRISSAKAA
jgi:hypothetical protein